MKTKCYSYMGKCPCMLCKKYCCGTKADDNGLTDTEKLCDKAREYCESCAIEHKQKEVNNVTN